MCNSFSPHHLGRSRSRCSHRMVSWPRLRKRPLLESFLLELADCRSKIENGERFHTRDTYAGAFCTVESSIRTASSNKGVLSGGETEAVRETNISYAAARRYSSCSCVTGLKSFSNSTIRIITSHSGGDDLRRHAFARCWTFKDLSRLDIVCWNRVSACKYLLITRATQLQEMCLEVPTILWSQTYRIAGHGNNFGQDFLRPAGVRRAPQVSVWGSIELPSSQGSAASMYLGARSTQGADGTYRATAVMNHRIKHITWLCYFAWGLPWFCWLGKTPELPTEAAYQINK